MHLGEFIDGVLWAKVAVALFCGGIVGVERQLRGKPAGMRTSCLICLGTMMFVHLGRAIASSDADPTRVLGQVVTGIGFLGAGVIMTRDGMLTGVTSAAVVWILAAAGSAAGLGKFAEAISMSVMTVGILVGVERLELAFSSLRRGVHAKTLASAQAVGPELGDLQTVRVRSRAHHMSGAIEVRGNARESNAERS